LALHILFAAIFVGSNVFLEFLLSRRLALIPPGQAARLSERLGLDFAVLTWVSLVGMGASGAVLLWKDGLLQNLAHPEFYTSGYGSALITMMGLWLTLVVAGAVITFFLRPRVTPKLPIDATREEVDGARERGMRTATWLRHLARYNLVASALAVIVGGFLNYGGFF
jgi:uncharacterized membrane protein